MEVLEVIKARRTIRKFKPDPIPPEIINHVLEAATWAPSQRNCQPWEFIEVGPETRAQLLSLLQAKLDELLAAPDLPEPKRQGMLALRDDFGGAPYMIAVLSRAPEEPIDRVDNPASVAAAVQNICLAAWGQGIGAVWLSLGSAPPARPILRVPEGAEVVALLALGYPAVIPPAPPREPYTDRLRRLP